MIKNWILLLFLCVAELSYAVWPGGSTGEALAVTITVTDTPPQIQLHWLASTAAAGYIIERRAPGTTVWTTVGNAAPDSTGWTDSNVVVGTAYEYRVSHATTPSDSAGYTANKLAAIERPLLENRGKFILLVEQSMAAPLAAEIKRLEQDLAGDGWTVIRHDVPRHDYKNFTVKGGATNLAWINDREAIKNIIRTDYNADPANVKAVFLLGHITIPFSGWIIPDGHYFRPAPADMYYADMHGTWTDTSSHAAAGGYPNLPDDGIFDQNSAPNGNVDLQYGRVDLADMPIYAPKSEVYLMRQYLNKDHDYRVRNFTVQNRAWVSSNGYSVLDLFAMAGGIFGSSNVVSTGSTPTFLAQMAVDDYLCGFTDLYYPSAADFLTHDKSKVVFTSMYISYVWEWYKADNDMKAFIGNAGNTLTCYYFAGQSYPNRNGEYHHMALGEPMGYCARLGSGPVTTRSVEFQFLGDPSLRMFMISPATNLLGNKNGNQVSLSWTASTEAGVEGYFVYRSTSATGPFTRLTPDLVLGTTFTDTSAPAGDVTYMVRPVKLQVTNSGSYWDMGQGAFISLGDVVNGAPVASNGSASTNKNFPVSFSLNATDADGNSLSYYFTKLPDHGDLSGVPPNVTYTPALNWSGPDTFQFYVTDGKLNSNVATVSVITQNVNNPPVATGQSVIVNVSQSLSEPITLSATDINNEPLTYSIVANPQHGTISLNGNIATFTATAGYTGADSFTFKANDGMDDSNVATVSLTIKTNATPVAKAATVTVAEEGSVSITLKGTDADLDVLTYTVLTQPQHGTLTGSGKNYTYTPYLNYNGPDSFTFKVNDGTVDSLPGTVSITVTPVNDPPTASAQTVMTVKDTPSPTIHLQGADIDGDLLTFSITTNPTHGTLSGTSPDFIYTPAAGYVGIDSFQFKSVDPAGGMSAATKVSIFITETAQGMLPLQIGNGKIASGDNFSIAVKQSGIASAWGYNGTGNLGIGTTDELSVSFLPFSNLSNVVKAAGGANHALALKSDGTVWAWGYNYYGQLGNGASGVTANSYVPVQTTGLSDVIDIDAGQLHSVALKSDGTVWSWGYNYNGQLGNGTSGSTAGSSVPVQVSNLTGVIAVATSSSHVLALKSDGTVWAWGNNSSGQLGNGTSGSMNNVPVQVNNLTGVIAVATGSIHSLALKSDGTVWSWGYNFYGQLGNGTATNSLVPVQVSDLSGVIAIAGGGYHSLALKSDGTVWAWGNNSSGQLGNGTSGSVNSSNVPGQVNNLSAVIAIAGGGYHSLALKSDGTVWSWGYNSNGQLGNAASGGAAHSAIPVQVLEINPGSAPANTAPVANAQSVTTNEDVVLGINLSGSDAEGSPLTYSVVTQPAHGVLNGTGLARTYTPDLNYNGTDSFTFKVNDGSLDSAVATVSITINSVNDAPTISDIVDQTTNQGVSTSAITFTVGDVDTSVGSLTVTATSSNTVLLPVANITLAGTSTDRTMTLSPVASQSGTVTVTVIVSDGYLTATTSFVLTVIPNVPPTITAQPVTQSVAVGQAATFNVAVSGTAPFTYQWKKNGANISGATGSSYTTPVTAIGDNGSVFSVTVTNVAGSTTSSGATLTVTNPPTITSISPNTGSIAGGAIISINGTNMSGTSSVLFDGISATITSVTATKVKCTLPAHAAGVVDVVLTSPNGTVTKSAGFTYFLPPTITSVSPTSGPIAGGTTVTINGTNLTGASSVVFGSASATSVNVINANQLTCVAPANPTGVVFVRVTTPGGTATQNNAFTYTTVAPPTISSVSPLYGALGGNTKITINGTNLLGTTSVTVDGLPATTVVVVSATQVTCFTPAHAAGSVNISLTTANGTATSVGAFTYLALPTITTISPTSGPVAGGTLVTINGTNLLGVTKVTFGGLTATSLTLVNANQITCVAPASAAGVVSVKVTAGGGSVTKSSAYTYY